MGCHPGRIRFACPVGRLAGAERQRRAVRRHAIRSQRREAGAREGQHRSGVRIGKARGHPSLLRAIPGARTVRAELRGRGHPRRGWPRAVRLAGRLHRPPHDRRGAGPQARAASRAIHRRRGNVRPQQLRRRRAGGGTAVADGGRAGARAVHALGRTGLGYLRPGARRRSARRGRRRRPHHRIRVRRLASQLELERHHVAARRLRTRGDVAVLECAGRERPRLRRHVRDPEPSAGQSLARRSEISQGRVAALASRPVVRFRLRAGGRSAGRAAAARSGAVPPRQHRRCAVARRARRRRCGGRVDAAHDARRALPMAARGAAAAASGSARTSLRTARRWQISK